MSSVCDLSNDYGVIRCHGTDAKKFLQGQLTCDLEQLTTSNSLLGCYCDHKGRMLASFRILLEKDQYLLLLPHSMVASTLQELNKFAVFSKIKLEDASNQYSHLGILGVMPEIDHDTLRMVEISAHPERIHLLGNNKSIQIFKLALSDNLIPSSSDNWNLLDIQHCLPTILPQTRGLFLPHHLNFNTLGISFKKGCYRGQEIIARMEYLGKIKQHLYQAYCIESAVEPGVTLMNQDNKIVGHVVNVATGLEKNQLELLVTVLDDQKEIYIMNTELSVVLRNHKDAKIQRNIELKSDEG